MEVTTVPVMRLDGYTQRNIQWIEKARSLMKLKKNIEELEILEDTLTQELKFLSQGINSCGGGFKFGQIFRKGSINYKLVPELQDINLEPYRTKDVEIWKLQLELE